MHLLYTAKVEWSSKNVATRKKHVSFGLVLLLTSRRWLPKRCLTRAAGGGHMGIWYVTDMHQTIASKCWAYHLLLMQPENTCRIDPIWFMPSWYEQWKWIFARSISWHEISIGLSSAGVDSNIIPMLRFWRIIVTSVVNQAGVSHFELYLKVCVFATCSFLLKLTFHMRTNPSAHFALESGTKSATKTWNWVTFRFRIVLRPLWITWLWKMMCPNDSFKRSCDVLNWAYDWICRVPYPIKN